MNELNRSYRFGDEYQEMKVMFCFTKTDGVQKKNATPVTVIVGRIPYMDF